MLETYNKKIFFLFSFITHIVILFLFYFIGVHGSSGNGNGYIELGLEPGSGGGGAEIIKDEKINPDKIIKEDAVAVKDKNISKKENDSKSSQGNPSGSGTGTGTGSGTGDGKGSGINLGLPSPPKPVEEIYLVAVDEMPEPIGGIQRIVSQILIPPDVKAKKLSGTVFVLAYVDENGSVRKTLLTKGIGSGYDEAAMRAVALSRFKPGKHHGRYVKVQVQIPVPINTN